MNSFGTALTPMMPVGRTASTASTKVAIGAPVLRERLLKVRKIGARGHDQTIDIEQHVAVPRLVQVHALARHREADQFGDAGRRRAGAEKQEPLVGEFLPGDPQGARMPASATPAVPWMSSLKVQTLSR